MNHMARIAALALALLGTFVTAAPFGASTVPRYFQASPYTRRGLSVVQVQYELGAIVSNGTAIFGPRSSAWANATERWNTFDVPHIEIVVEVKTEADVSKVVKYCNDNSIEFLAYTRGHGFTSTLTKFRGIEINLSQLKAIKIQPDGKSAWFQGGTYGKLVIDTLWDRGYVTTTGSSGCVGLMGPGLGGGFGRYQGQYGLVSDNFVNLNVVLADGSTVTVNETSHSDLFWAMRGAGHNFGIVTSAELKIYPRKIHVDTWHYHNYVWTQDKLEAVFEALNKFQGKGEIPPLMGANFGQFSVEPSTNQTKAVISWTFAYEGPAQEAEALLKPFNDIKAILSTSGDVPYPQLMALQGTGINSPSCASNPYIGGTANLQVYNVTAERQIMDVLNERISQHPQLAAGARVFHEGYASKRTQEIDPRSTAYAHRDDYLVVFFAAVASPGLEKVARKLTQDVRRFWYGGQPGRLPTAYVNHAAGGETVESLYGYEPWRLERLRHLKAKYDPKNSFRFYNPIVKEYM
ncbi:hypothetical protein CDD80_848 [Ophiocordyceps camponoti-rufipedis]|uniref:FAD-binding PCMH-type domain-containing protein n=1 Tax=Ophiocordyceps camponoti-rufipedis TaxID=2004952 RepID=A0A2C5XY31_9HYPO|nr:hypothetical protein CDD80_848 [Ophiocordyceps camponoti-rufipedis]